MSFHLLAYEEALGINADNTDLDAVPDSEFTRRNDHFIFTENYNLLAAYYQAASAIRARFNVPMWNNVGRHQIFPFHRSATIPDDPRVQDLREMPLALPDNEEIAIEGSNNLAAATEESTAFLWIAPPSWRRNVPRGLQRLTLRATGAAAGTAQAWGALGALTMAENIRGGWYTLLGAQCFDAGSLAVRFVFPRPTIYNGRKFRPGILCQEALGDRPALPGINGFGVLGKFHSFELPQIEIYANATAASTQQFWLDVVWHGDAEPAA